MNEGGSLGRHEKESTREPIREMGSEMPRYFWVLFSGGCM